MSARDYELSINLLSKKNNQPTFFKQYDNGNIIEAEVTRDDVKVILTNETVIAFFELPDKTILQKNCSINQEGNIICVLDNNILSQAGKAYMELVIADGTSISTTSTITLDIEKTIDRNGAVTTIVKWDIVQEILEFDGGKLITEIATLSSKIDIANQLKIDLENDVTQGSALKTELDTTINTATTKKGELAAVNNTATNLHSSLQGDIAAGNTLHGNLSSDINTGNTLHTNLQNDINTGNTLKTGLDIDITQGTTLKNQLEADINTAQTKKTELESAILTGDLNNYAKKTDLNEINNTLGSGVIATPALSYGMNSKIVNPVKVPVIPEVAWSGRHYVNLLGKDGNCEDVSKWPTGNGSTSILDGTAKVFGSNSIKLTHTQVSVDYCFVVQDLTNRIDKNKYYCVSAYVKCGTCLHMYSVFGPNAGWKNGNFVVDKNNFQRSFAKASPADMASSNTFGIYIILIPSGAAGSYVGTGWIDGIMLTEITQAEFNDANYQPPPYVDSYGILTNPYIEIRHDNLVRNGNGEEGVNWWVKHSALGTFRLYNGYFYLRSETTDSVYAYQKLKLKRNTDYWITPNVAVYIDLGYNGDNAWQNTAVKGAVTTNRVFNTGNNTDFIVMMLSGVKQTDTFIKEIMLIEGTSQLSYKPCRIERCAIEGKFGDGDTVTLKDGKAEGLINWKHKTLFGKDYGWQLNYDGTGKKLIHAIIDPQSTANGNITTNPVIAVKYDGKILTIDDSFATADTFMHRFWEAVGKIIISVADIDTGWSETVNPNSDEVKAFMNGWKAVRTAGIRYVAWVSVIDGKPPEGTLNVFSNGNNAAGQNKLNVVTSTGLTVGDYVCIKLDTGAYQLVSITAIAGGQLTVNANLSATVAYGNDVFLADKETGSDKLITWCKNNIAPNYEGYQLHYKLANPEPITDTNIKVVGDIPKIDTGDNYVYLDSGIVLCEVIIPQSDTVGNYVINDYTRNSALKSKLGSFIDIGKNYITDFSNWTIWLEPARTGGVGSLYFIPAAKYDSNATYTVDYMITPELAPNTGTITLAFKQDLVSGITSVANAIESRQKSDSALDNLIDESVYEKIVFPMLISRAYKNGPNVGFQIFIPISRKKAVPIVKIVDYAMAYTDESAGYNTVSKGTINIVATNITTKGVRVYCLYTGGNTTIISNLLNYGGWFGFTLELDCRGRI